MSEQEEDFASMFEASVEARRFDGADGRGHRRRVRYPRWSSSTWAAKPRLSSTSRK